MKVYRGLGDKTLKKRRRALAVGIFDGVHRGHVKILSALRRDAKKLGVRAMVVTFDPHPARILAPKKFRPPNLMSLEGRLGRFEALGLDEVLLIRFNRAFSQKTREFFLENILLGRLGAVSLTVGHDFCFGKNAAGDHVYLKNESRRLGFRLRRVGALKLKNDVISSTRVRKLIEAGDLQRVERMLGRPLCLTGTVIRGRGRGKSVGFPTANLNPHHEALPPEGVYAAYGRFDSKRLKGVVHIGRRPTFKDAQKSVEAHFLNFNENIYGQTLELDFVRRIRGIRRFKSAAALGQAITNDIHAASAIL